MRNNSVFTTLLKKYYTRKGNRILFKEKYTLNNLANSMWEELGYKNMDASILSKVVNGNRIFSPRQLQAFCNVLNISKEEEETLKTSLIQEVNIKKDIRISNYYLPKKEIVEMTLELSRDLFNMFIQGKCKDLNILTSLVNNNINLLNPDLMSNAVRKELLKAEAKNIYIRSKIENIDKNPDILFIRVQKNCKKLLKLSKLLNDEEIYGMSLALLGSAYGECGYYKHENLKYEYYKRVLYNSNTALKYLPKTSPFALFALRTLAFVYSELKDKDGILKIWNKIDSIIEMQENKNSTPMLYLCGTIPVGASIVMKGNPFRLREKAISFFQFSLAGKGMYELFDIKSELITLRNLSIKDEKHVYKLIEKGKYIAEQEACIKHLEFLNEYEKNYFS